ncbi:hypothetical protein HK100_007595 [Physocladia obscura]|uniref:HMG box domain-containing protein n=1 Tax=Physocladia obscura TaxID=109957 RepID=A0AAD5SQ78_9FUNG|nr:hypothetical protein HK100_007595 [Physocladia obscura]
MFPKTSTSFSLRFTAASRFASLSESMPVSHLALTASFASVSKALVDPQKEKLARKKLRALKAKSVSVTLPKRPLGAYALFTTDKWPQLHKTPEMQALPFPQRLQAVIASGVKLWAAISSTDKKIYENRATDAKVAYKKALDEYLNTRTPTDIVVEQRIRSLKQSLSPNAYVARVAADPKAPKLPASAQNLFFKDFKHTGTPLEKFKAAAAEWKILDTESKKPYVLEAIALKTAYIEAKSKYEQTTGISQIRKSLEKELHNISKKPMAKKPARKVSKDPTIKKPTAKKTITKKVISKKVVSKKLIKETDKKKLAKKIKDKKIAAKKL